MLDWDMAHALIGDADNFHCLLIRLFLKADSDNFARLKSAFPNTERVVAHWRATGEFLPGVPYEGEGEA